MGQAQDALPKAIRKKTKAELVDWLMARAEVCEDTRRALSTWAAPEAEPKALATALRKQITATWAKVKRSRNPFRMASPVAAELEPVLAGIESLLERGEAAVAEKLSRRFVEAAEAGTGHIDDSYGRLWPVLRESVVLWGRAWGALGPKDIESLAREVQSGVLENEASIRDHMIRDFAEALGQEGLRTLERGLREQLEVDRCDTELKDYLRDRCAHHLADVADALGDPDLYIEARQLGGREDVYALPIGRRLLDAQRHEEALVWLEKAAEGRGHFSGEPEDATSLRARTLVALGREDEARELLWAEFRQSLSWNAYEQLAAGLSEPERTKLQAQALDCAEQYRSGLAAAGFLVEHGAIERAAKLVTDDPNRFSGEFYPAMISLAENFAPLYPAAAWHLYRNLARNILDEARARAYSHAAKYLQKTRELAEAAHLRAEHETWESELKTKHGRKRSFWERLTE